ncbi:MAG: hypothetical protein K6C40_05120, partial [Thermoguttaceae bacterium]|nr:hypothetical protein [Thermoguttaceae bacterium]
ADDGRVDQETDGRFVVIWSAMIQSRKRHSSLSLAAIQPRRGVCRGSAQDVPHEKIVFEAPDFSVAK